MIRDTDKEALVVRNYIYVHITYFAAFEAPVRNTSTYVQVVAVLGSSC